MFRKKNRRATDLYTSWILVKIIFRFRMTVDVLAATNMSQ